MVERESYSQALQLSYGRGSGQFADAKCSGKEVVMAAPLPSNTAPIALLHNPLVKRLGVLASLSEDEIALLTRQSSIARHYKARKQLVAQGEPIARVFALLKGWAAQVQILSDGRRQIL